METQKIIVQLDDGQEAIMEVQCGSQQIECGNGNKAFKPSMEYLKVAKNIIHNLKKIDVKPSEVELEFGVKLSLETGNLVSWIATDVNAETAIRVKMKWQNTRE